MPKMFQDKDSSTMPKMFQDVRIRDDKDRTFAPPDNIDDFDKLTNLAEYLTPLEKNKYIDKYTSFNDKQPLKKINPEYMTQIVDDEKKYIENKKFYLDESIKGYEKIHFFNEKIKSNPTMSTKEINIITQLKELHGLRRQYFIKKFNNELEKNKDINLKLIDDHIHQLENELRNQKGSGSFTYQNKFGKLLTLLT